MAQPSSNDGSIQMGRVNVEAGMEMLEQAIPTLGSDTPEGHAVIKALSILSKVFQRQQAQGLVPAQIQELARQQQQSPLSQIMGGGQPPAGAAPQGAPGQPPQQAAA